MNGLLEVARWPWLRMASVTPRAARQAECSKGSKVSSKLGAQRGTNMHGETRHDPMRPARPKPTPHDKLFSAGDQGESELIAANQCGAPTSWCHHAVHRPASWPPPPPPRASQITHACGDAFLSISARSSTAVLVERVGEVAWGRGDCRRGIRPARRGPHRPPPSDIPTHPTPSSAHNAAQRVDVREGARRAQADPSVATLRADIAAGPSPLFVIFSSKPGEDGKPWCGFCVKAEPGIEKVFSGEPCTCLLLPPPPVATDIPDGLLVKYGPEE